MPGLFDGTEISERAGPIRAGRERVSRKRSSAVPLLPKGGRHPTIGVAPPRSAFIATTSAHRKDNLYRSNW